MTTVHTNKDRYAVVGNPIKHSKSPRIHALFAEQVGMADAMVYKKKRVLPKHFETYVKRFFYKGGKGLNVTLPYKLKAFEFADKYGDVDGPARHAGAVNTLKFDNGELIGFNTDGVGLIRDLGNKLSSNIGPSGANLVGRSVLILGAGGAVRGVLSKIIEEGFSEIIIANRAKATAAELAKKFNHIQSKVKIKGCGYDELDKKAIDLIINGTSASLSGDLPPLSKALIREDSVCYDMMYSKNPTVFMQWASTNGCKHVSDGLGMLVEQAAESFFIWRGIRPETKSVIEKVRQEL